jgi:hypothetical protein
MARIDFVTGNAQQYLPEVEALATVPDRAEAALSGQAGGDLNAASADGEWSAGRVLQHMAFYAAENGHNLRLMAWQEGPEMAMWDEDETIAEHGWAQLGGSALISALTEQLTQSVELLKDLPDAWWGRPGIHPRRGLLSIRQFVRRQNSHFDNHIEQLSAIG